MTFKSFDVDTDHTEEFLGEFTLEQLQEINDTIAEDIKDMVIGESRLLEDCSDEGFPGGLRYERIA
jgi:hypothetical protein